MIEPTTSPPTPQIPELKKKFWHTPVSAAIGACVGAYACFPFEGLKKRVQSGQTISLHPLELYRGSSSFALSVTAATVSSMTVHSYLSSGKSRDAPTQKQRATMAVSSGMIGAALGSTPVENIILQQQLSKVGPFQALKILTAKSPTRLWLGLPELALREAGFAGVMLWAGSAAEQKALDATGNPTIGKLAKLATSILGAATTQPFDTLATRRQMENGKLSSKQALTHLLKEKGALGLFKGLHHRVFLFTGCSLLIPTVEKETKNALSKID